MPIWMQMKTYNSKILVSNCLSFSLSHSNTICMYIAFSILTLFVGFWKGIQPAKCFAVAIHVGETPRASGLTYDHCGKKGLLKQNPRAYVVYIYGTIRYVRYVFLLVSCSNFVPKTHHFWDIRLVVTLKSGSEVTRDHWNWYHLSTNACRIQETVCYMVSAMTGDWTTALSRKERKNRSKRDDASKYERPTPVADVPLNKMDTPNSSPSPGSNKSKKKVHTIRYYFNNQARVVAYLVWPIAQRAPSSYLWWWCLCKTLSSVLWQLTLFTTIILYYKLTNAVQTPCKLKKQ